jgi:hypothetical protein
VRLRDSQVRRWPAGDERQVRSSVENNVSKACQIENIVSEHSFGPPIDLKSIRQAHKHSENMVNRVCATCRHGEINGFERWAKVDMHRAQV